MIKLLKLTLLVLSLMLLKPAENQAQAYCPIAVYNGNNHVGLVSSGIYNSFVDGDYLLTLFSTELSCFIDNQLVHFTRTTNVNTYVPGAPPAIGVVFDISASSCAGLLSDNILQTGGTSIIAVRPSDGLQFFTLNFTDNIPDECSYAALPVTFVSFNASWTTFGSDLKLQWTTNDESDMDHFTVEKCTLGGPWVKVAQLPAQNGMINNYQWHDYSPIFKAVYRITGVDIDCKKTYSTQALVSCNSCPTTWSPPSLTPDCSAPVNGPSITGPDYICDNSRKLYRLNGVTGEATVTWSLSSYWNGTLNQASRMAFLTPSGNPGIVTLTATVVKNGVTTTYSKNVTLGIPPIYVTADNTPFSDCNSSIRHQATITPFPGSHDYDYSWYQNGSYIGTGLSRYWIVTPGQIINYQIYWNGPCGQSVYNGSSMGPIFESKIAPPAFTVNPNPARGGNINVTMLRPICPEPPGPAPLKIFSSGRSTEVQIYDMYGNFRKSVKVKRGDTRFTISAPELPTGLYYLHVTEPGRKPVKLKVWVEK